MIKQAPDPVADNTSAKSTEARLIKAQAVAGSLFFIFLLLHLSNTVLAAFGAETYNNYQRSIRQIYQHPILEIVLVIAPLITHVVAGVWLYLRRKKWQINATLKYRVQTWSGFFLLLVVFGHMLATRGIAYWFGPIAEFEGVSFSIWWIPGYFYPYYFLLFMAGLYHGSMGAVTLLRRLGFARSVRVSRIPVWITTFGAAAATFSLLAFGGVLFEIDDPRDNDYARQYSELLDIDLSRPHK